jgi:hypothetical protein
MRGNETYTGRMVSTGRMQDNYNVNSVPAGERPGCVSVVSYRKPVKDDGVTLLKNVTVQFGQLIIAKCA